MLNVKLVTNKLSEEGLNATAITIIVFCFLLFVLVLNLAIFAFLGFLFAYLWNTFAAPLFPNVSTVVWWQAALLLLGIRILIGFFKN